MTFDMAVKELKLGKVIYDKRYPKVCYKYNAHNDIIYKFRMSSCNKNKWYYVEEDAVGFQEILFDDWDILDISGLTFVY